ncbi:MAG: ABC transporter ATP-binding protein [Synergistaceae bacterium]|jgi:sulfonate transport system ATP-binding protein|nr:ABC transporter ATP-binding protein [Synergistaceae bacterium]
MAWFEAQDVRKEYPFGESVNAALDGFSLSAGRGDFVSIIGRSGSGKTTFLRVVAGLADRTSGEITFGGSRSARIGMVFQEPRLMPWLTVEENVLFAYMKLGESDIPRARAARLLEMLGLSKYKDARPSSLSVGMAHRVALGRALCFEPELVLMDEPFASLDYITRRSLQGEISKLYLAGEKTFFLVTHDVDEAVALSRRIVILDCGKALSEVKIDLGYPRERADPNFASTVERVMSLIPK